MMSMNVITEDQYSYSQYWVSTALNDHFLFRVKACADAHIILSDLMQGLGRYIIASHFYLSELNSLIVFYFKMNSV